MFLLSISPVLDTNISHLDTHKHTHTQPRTRQLCVLPFPLLPAPKSESRKRRRKPGNLLEGLTVFQGAVPSEAHSVRPDPGSCFQKAQHGNQRPCHVYTSFVSPALQLPSHVQTFFSSLNPPLLPEFWG